MRSNVKEGWDLFFKLWNIKCQSQRQRDYKQKMFKTPFFLNYFSQMEEKFKKVFFPFDFMKILAFSF